MTLPELREKIKGYYRELWLTFVIILVATLSFGIGRLSAPSGREPIKIEYEDLISSSTTHPLTRRGGGGEAETIVASKNGSKYHYSYCPGAKQIKEENRIAFASAALAESAGYTLAANCKPR